MLRADDQVMVLTGLLVWVLLAVLTAAVFAALCRAGLQDEQAEMDDDLAALSADAPPPPGRAPVRRAG